MAFPRTHWERAEPGDVGVDAAALDAARQWYETQAGHGRFRVAVVRHGKLIAEWRRDVEPDEQSRCASAAKALYSCMLGIAVEEGVIPSADARVVDYYPRMMDVPPGSGPKPGRYAFEKDRAITFRQLISNTSGYMKPNENPGEMHHYQTFGMNVLCHALAAAYGVPTCGELIDAKIREPIGATWRWEHTNFDLPPEARIDVFGNYTQIYATAADLLRQGWLWANGGRWADRQVVPEAWLAEATRSVEGVQWAEPRSELCYGCGFWTNSHGRLWPGLPTDGFAAYGAGRIAVNVFPSLGLVVVQAPAAFEDQAFDSQPLLGRVVAACA